MLAHISLKTQTFIKMILENHSEVGKQIIIGMIYTSLPLQLFVSCSFAPPSGNGVKR